MANRGALRARQLRRWANVSASMVQRDDCFLTEIKPWSEYREVQLDEGYFEELLD